jgi:hypothetical protein
VSPKISILPLSSYLKPSRISQYVSLKITLTNIQDILNKINLFSIELHLICSKYYPFIL